MAIAMGVNYAFQFAEQYRGWNRGGGWGTDPLELQDAAYECEHGHLFTTSPPRCECFTKGTA
jgi:hypothetical protein